MTGIGLIGSWAIACRTLAIRAADTESRPGIHPGENRAETEKPKLRLTRRGFVEEQNIRLRNELQANGHPPHLTTTNSSSLPTSHVTNSSILDMVNSELLEKVEYALLFLSIWNALGEPQTSAE